MVVNRINFMEISVSIELLGSFDELKSNEVAVANIVIKSLPIRNRALVGKQIEKLVFEQYKSALRLALSSEIVNGKLVPIKTCDQ